MLGMDETEEGPQPADFLKFGGLPLELKALEAFRSVGAHAFHSEYFPDWDEGKQREIDVVAEFWPPRFHGVSERIPVQLVYVVECKAVEGDWLVYQSERQASRLEQFARNLTYDVLVPTYAHHPTDKTLTSKMPHVVTSHLSWPKTPMYQAQSLGSQQKAAYSAISQAVSACVGLSMFARGQGDRREYLTIWIPVVVTTARLWSVDTEANQLKAIPVDVPVVVGMRIRDPSLYHCVWIVQEKHLDVFATAAAEDARLLRLDT
jgi:hypothetical protein